MTDSLVETYTKIIPECGRKIVLARVDLIRKWQDFSHGKIGKLKGSYKAKVSETFIN